MAAFLVRTTNNLSPDHPADHRDQLRAAERRRANELRAAGQLIKLWRVPGTTGSVGVYEVADVTELHEILASLPMWPWMEIVVEPLATHPSEPEAQKPTSAHAEHSAGGFDNDSD